MKGMLVTGVVLLATVGVLPAQEAESGKALLAAARKRAADAKGKVGPEREQVLLDCVRILSMVPEKAPEDAAAVARAHLELGRTWRRLGKLEQAEEAFLAASRIPSESRPCCDALHDLASLYRKTKRKEPALAVLQRIVEEFPGEPRSRAEALMRIAGWQRDAKEYPAAEETLRRCLKEHADLWRPSVDALDDLVALKIRQKAYDDARKVLDAHTDSIRARFAGSAREESVENALMKMGSRGRLEKVAGGGTGEGQKDG